MGHTNIRNAYTAFLAALQSAGYSSDEIEELTRWLASGPKPKPAPHPTLLIRIQHILPDVDRPAEFGRWFAGGNTITKPAPTKATKTTKATKPQPVDVDLAAAIADVVADLSL